MGQHEEMLKLRAKGYTLVEIGEEFGVSKQRAHQLVGHTGYKGSNLRIGQLVDAKWLATQKRARRTDKEIAQELGTTACVVRNARRRLGVPAPSRGWTIQTLGQALRAWAEHHGLVLTCSNLVATGHSGLACAICELGGYSLWRGKLGQTLNPDSSVARGRHFQEEALATLQEHGHKTHLMPWRHPFDILVDDTLRIDVKGSKRYSRGHFAFSLRQPQSGHRLDCDIVMLGCENSSITWYIIPRSKLGNRQGVAIFPLSPRSMWTDYHEAWHLMEASH